MSATHTPTPTPAVSASDGANSCRPEGRWRGGWPAVLSLAAGSFALVTNEFLPIGLLGGVHRGLHVSEGTAGTMVTAPGVVAAVAAPLLPVALRRLDRRAALLGLGLVFVLADLLAAAAPDYQVMLLARALLGVGIGGFWSVAMGLSSRLVPQAQAQRATALVFGGVSVGTVVGVPAGPLLAHAVGWRGAFLVVALLGLVPVLLQAVLLPRLPVAAPVSLGSLGALLRRPRARRVLLVAALAVAAHFGAYTFVTPFLQQRTGAGTGLVSTLLLVFAAAGIVGNAAAGAALTRRTRPVLLAVLAGLAAATVLTPLLGDAPGWAFALLAVWGLAYGGVPVALQTWLFRSAPEAADENGAGLFVAVFQASIAVGSLLGSLAVDAAGVRAAMLGGGALAVAGLALAATVRRAD